MAVAPRRMERGDQCPEAGLSISLTSQGKLTLGTLILNERKEKRKERKETTREGGGVEGRGDIGIQWQRNETSGPAAQTSAGTNPDTQLLLAFDSISSRSDQVPSERVGHGISESHHKNASLGLNCYPDSLPTAEEGCLDSYTHSGLVSYHHPSCCTHNIRDKTTLNLSIF